MWDCGKCGTTGIAGSLTFCPTCRAERPAEDVAAEDQDQEVSGPEKDADPPVVPPAGDDTGTSPSPRKRSGGKASGQDNN